MASRALPRCASHEGSPLVTDQLAMPAEQGLRSGQESLQACAQQEPAECGQQNPIARLPGWLSDLALQDTKLMAQSQHLGSELGVRAGADQHEVGEEADELIESENHGRGSCQIARQPWRSDRAPLQRFTPGEAPGPAIELTLGGVRHTHGCPPPPQPERGLPSAQESDLAKRSISSNSPSSLERAKEGRPGNRQCSR